MKTMDISADKSIRLPLNDQIKGQIRDLIQAGRLKTGEKLPTIRELSSQLAVNINTAALAYRDLAQEGLVVTQRGKGTFVAAAPEMETLPTLRRVKLERMVDVFIQEADRLAYRPEEVEAAIMDRLRNWGS
ncbi:MAG: GntR family transcriptional regulator [Anaerolineales bacterium]|nr:GntR family transcriptional regulator [Anaerolineae bacterium]PWB51974.1 MAG: GntR family transcriptional regulator [Anaerolineales bacterium]